VACGRLSAYFETDMNVWDIAAGALIVQESGGRVTDVWGRVYELTTRNLVSSNGRIHEELLDVLYEAEMFMPMDKDRQRSRE
jgi:myo-inositol-1(or 4)-monophosphatase